MAFYFWLHPLATMFVTSGMKLVSGASGAEGQVLQRLHPGSGNALIRRHGVHRGTGREVTHTHGRITSISAAVTSLTCLSSQTPGPSDGPQTRESGSRLECGCALQKRRPRCFFFFFSPIHSLFCFILFLCYSPDFLYGLFLSLPQTRTLVVSGITAIATSGNLVG